MFAWLRGCPPSHHVPVSDEIRRSALLAEDIAQPGGRGVDPAAAPDLAQQRADLGEGQPARCGRYSRRLADAAIGGRRVEICLAVRRFFCPAPSCERKMRA